MYANWRERSIAQFGSSVHELFQPNGSLSGASSSAAWALKYGFAFDNAVEQGFSFRVPFEDG